MASKIKIYTGNKIFGGLQQIVTCHSTELGCKTSFSVFIPPQASSKNVPVIYWLSGLTYNEKSFAQKAGAQRYAAKEGVMIVSPDTSPRGLNIPGDTDFWDFGVGAGFYLNATKEPWKKNYRMYSYFIRELLNVVKDNFPVVENKMSIFGHSMGGHGAFICTLKNPGLFTSASAFAPICNPSNCPWGIKAFTNYLGPKETPGSNWHLWDTCELTKTYDGPKIEFIMDQGTNDKFYKEKQLLPENLIDICKKNNNNVKASLKWRKNYDHSFFFISTFVGEHIRYHAAKLKEKKFFKT